MTYYCTQDWGSYYERSKWLLPPSESDSTSPQANCSLVSHVLVLCSLCLHRLQTTLEVEGVCAHFDLFLNRFFFGPPADCLFRGFGGSVVPSLLICAIQTGIILSFNSALYVCTLSTYIDRTSWKAKRWLSLRKAIASTHRYPNSCHCPHSHVFCWSLIVYWVIGVDFVVFFLMIVYSLPFSRSWYTSYAATWFQRLCRIPFKFSTPPSFPLCFILNVEICFIIVVMSSENNHDLSQAFSNMLFTDSDMFDCYLSYDSVFVAILL